MFLGISSGESGALAITFRSLGKNLRRRLDHPKPIPDSISRARTFDLLSPKSGPNMAAAKGCLDGRGRSGCENTQQELFGPLPNT